eukprot:m51a1_g12576 hypothetical protein (101) ;mRNA; r:1655-2295
MACFLWCQGAPAVQKLALASFLSFLQLGDISGCWDWDIPSGSVHWAFVEDKWTLVVLLNLIILVNTSMKKQLSCLVLNPAFSVAGVQKKNMVISILSVVL